MIKYSNDEAQGVDAPRPAGSGDVPPSVRVHQTKRTPKRGNSIIRTVRENDYRTSKLPDCATSDHPASVINRMHYVPVSFVAKDWSVTPRRIRSLLAAQRLEGRQGANGYWEVVYPYHFIIGTRGPLLKRQQAPKRGRPKLAWSAE